MILHKCTINENNMMYGSWDMKRDKQCFVILGHFLPFLPFFTIFWQCAPSFLQGVGLSLQPNFQKVWGTYKKQIKISNILWQKKFISKNIFLS